MDKKQLHKTAHKVNFAPGMRTKIFGSLTKEEQVQLLRTLERGVVRDIVNKIGTDVLVPLLEFLDPDEATDLLQLLPKHRRNATLERLTSALREDVELLSRFDPQTAGGLMTLDYVQVDENDTVGDAAKKFHEHEKRTGRPPTIVTMKDGHPVGSLPGYRLAFASPDDLVAKYAGRLLKIKHDAKQAEVFDFFRHHPHNKMAVLNDDGQVLGIIYSDDLIRALRERETASLYDFAGVHDEETVADTARTKIRFRYKWLIINLGTAFLAAGTVSLFNGTIAKYVLLAVYMPVVAGMGGNAATQTLAVVVRGISLHQLDLKSVLPTLRRELLAGLVNGIINGLLVAAVVLIFNHDVRLAIVLMMAMIGNLLVAGFFGTLVPVIMKRMGKDPAASATVFITTATDVLGFLMFLGFATLVLH